MEIITLDNDNYNFSYKNINYIINDLSPLLELQRYKLINNIKNECEKILHKYHHKLDINNILPRWIFLQFSNDTYHVDPLFPFDGQNNTQLKKDIFYLSNKSLYSHQIDRIIEEINLGIKFTSAISKLKDFIKSDLYIRNHKIQVEYDKPTDEFPFYYFWMIFKDEIKSSFDFEYTKFKIHKNLVDKLISQHRTQILDNQFKNILMCLILRYNTLDSLNQQLAVAPEFYEFIGNKYNINFELFASALNCHYKNYCSLFYDIEKHFNSKGSFNIIDIKKGFYVANPPFDEEIMKQMAIKFIDIMNKMKDELSIFITIPAWDNPNYGEYEVLTLLKKSGFVTFLYKLPKSRAKFFDYYNDRIIYPCDVYFILIQNDKSKENLKISNEMTELINRFFPIRNYISRELSYKNYENVYDATYVIINNTDKIPIIKNIIIKENPPNYLTKYAKKYYLSTSKKYSNSLLKVDLEKYNVNISNKQIISKKTNIIEANISTIMSLFFKDLLDVNNIMMIDLTYTCGEISYIIDRLKINYNEISNHILKKNILSNFNVNYLLNPRFFIKNTDDRNVDYLNYFNQFTNIYDFIFISGNFEYFMMKSIFYFTEQITYLLYFIQLYLLLKIQKKGGSFIFLMYSCDTEVYRKFIELLSQHYEEIILFQVKNIPGKLSYIVGKNFKGIDSKTLEILKDIVKDLVDFDPLLGSSLNIFDSKIRNKYNVIKHIRNDSYNKFIHNIFDFKENKMHEKIKNDINKKIDTFIKNILN